MQSLGSLARNIKPNQNIVEEEHNLKCERCGNTYDYYKFSNGQEFRHGCECELIEIGKKKERKEKKYLNRIFNQSNVNASLSDATVNSYQPQNEHQVHAKSTAIEYVKGFR